MSFQECYICSEETTCQQNIKFFTVEDDENKLVKAMENFGLEAIDKKLFDVSNPKKMDYPVTIQLPCQHCVHTKCIKQWSDSRIKAGLDDAYQCGLCKFYFGPYPKKSETYAEYLWRMFMSITTTVQDRVQDAVQNMPDNQELYYNLVKMSLVKIIFFNGVKYALAYAIAGDKGIDIVLRHDMPPKFLQQHPNGTYVFNGGKKSKSRMRRSKQKRRSKTSSKKLSPARSEKN
jgi:hypothetical protein